MTKPNHGPAGDEPRRGKIQWWVSILRAIAIYSGASWIYVALVALVHPETLPMQLTHVSKWPHEDTYGEVSFVVSFLSFTGYSLLRSRRHSPPRQDRNDS